jgi:hypothetical protein
MDGYSQKGVNWLGMMQCSLVRYIPVFQKMQMTGPSKTLVNVYKPMLHHVASRIFSYDLLTNCPSLTGAGHILHLQLHPVNEIYGCLPTVDMSCNSARFYIKPLNAELNPICPLLALFEAHHILHVSS